MDQGAPCGRFAAGEQSGMMLPEAITTRMLERLTVEGRERMDRIRELSEELRALTDAANSIAARYRLAQIELDDLKAAELMAATRREACGGRAAPRGAGASVDRAPSAG